MKRSILLSSILIASSIVLQAQWQLTGNAGTNPSIHFVGTTDNVPLKFRVNNIPMGYLAEYSLFLGNNAGISNTALYNTGVGWWSMKSNTTGYWNTAVGGSSLHNNTTGISNTATGYDALGSNTSGN